MSISGRRFELLLPLKFNDGSPVPDDLIADALVELRQRFGAVSSETQRIQGQWQHAGQVYRDELMRVFVDVEDTAQNRDFRPIYHISPDGKLATSEDFQRIRWAGCNYVGMQARTLPAALASGP